MGDQTSYFVRRAVEGEEGGMEWVVAHFDPLLRSQIRLRLRGRGDRDAVEDLAADVWVIVLSRIGRLLPREGRFAPVLARFLGTTALNRCNEWLRAHVRGRRRTLAGGASSSGEADALAGIPDETRGVVTRVYHREVRGALDLCLESMAEEQRQILALRLLEHRSNGEIARTLGLKPNTVAVRYRRALRDLKGRLDARGWREVSGMARFRSLDKEPEPGVVRE